MLARLPLPLQQFSPLSLQLSRPELERAVFSVQLAAQFNEIIDFFFQRLNQVFGHGRYTVSVGSRHYNARRFVGSMCAVGALYLKRAVCKPRTNSAAAAQR